MPTQSSVIYSIPNIKYKIVVSYYTTMNRLYNFREKLKRHYELAFEKFCDIRDIYRVPNRMSGVYTIILYNDEPSI